jgi:hypothetical protein
MKKRVLVLMLLVAICLPINSIAGEYFFETIMDETLSATKASKLVNLAGYKDFTVLVAITGGKSNQALMLDIQNSPAPGGGFVIARETVTLSAQGQVVWKNMYHVYAPYVSVVVKNPSPNTRARIFVYAGH